MPDSKISALTSGSAIAGTDVFPAVETTGTGPVKKTAAQIKTWAQQGVALTANNLSDLASASTSRTNLGLGSVATYNIGTSAYNIVQLDSSAKIPAVDGTQLTGVAKPTDKLSVFASTTAAELAGVISGTTGTGNLVFDTSPSFTTPTLGVATASTINKLTFTQPLSGATLTLANGSTLATSGAYSITLTSTGATNITLPTSGTLTTGANKLSDFSATTSSELRGVISDETGSGSLVFATSPTLVTPNLGTPASVTLTNATGLPISSGVSGLGSGVSVFLGTPSSANLASALTDKTGSGSAVFANSPTFVDDITLGTQGSAGTQGSVILANTANGSYQTTIKASNSATVAWTFTLPITAGTNGYVLSTDGLGNTAWVAQSGGGGSGSPGGSTTQIQYNDSGVFGGSAAFAWDDSVKTLRVGTSTAFTGKVKLGHASSAHYTTIQAGNATSAVTYTLPDADGATGAYLQTNGAGTLSWNAIPDPVAMALVFGS